MATGGLRRRSVWLVCWAVVAVVGVIMITQAFGWTGLRSMAIAQSLTPYLGLLLVPVLAAALWCGRYRLVTVGAAVGFAVLVLATPVVFPDRPPDAVTGSRGLRVAAVNLLYDNEQVAEVAEALRSRDLDVIVFSEYTAEHQEVLQQSALADDFAWRIDRAGLFAGGMALWSRDSVMVHSVPDTLNYSLDVTVDGPDGPVRVVAVHPPTPLHNFGAWQRDLDTIRTIGSTTDEPTLVAGDFNASYWHPDFRELLDAGYLDAHLALGHGFSTSWPTGGVMPTFVRLDHALTTGGLVPTDIEDFEVPGSDHRGFVVNVAPAR